MVRIRNKRNVSPLMYSDYTDLEDFQPHICRLNQSPWDVNPLPLPSMPSLTQAQVENEKIFMANKSMACSVAPTKSVAILPMESEDRSTEIDINKHCAKSVCRMRNCKNDVEGSYSYCKYHVEQLEKYVSDPSISLNDDPFSPFSSKNASSSKRTLAAGSTSGRTRRAAAKKTPSTSSRKSRGKQTEETKNVDLIIISSSSSSDMEVDTNPSQQISNGDQFVHLIDDDVDEDMGEAGDSPRRGRRRVKTRSMNHLIKQDKGKAKIPTK